MSTLITRISALIAFSVFSLSVHAAVLNISGGKLQGATGVDVGGTLYNVEFIDGSCVEVFSGCDQATDFPFLPMLTLTASQALLDQVFLDTPFGAFDSHPELTNGITYPIYSGMVLTPYFGDGVWSAGLIAYNGPSTSIDTTGPYWESVNYDLSLDSRAVYARWSRVPEPATMMLLGTGLIGFGAVRRRQSGKRAVY